MLAGLSVELQATGRLRSEDTEKLVMALTRDVAEYPQQWVLRAIVEHRKIGPWWPALADLVKQMQPQIDLRNSARRREQSRHQASQMKALPEPMRPPSADRKKQVMDALGYDPESRRRVEGRAWASECEARGLTVEQVESMDADEVGRKFIKRDKAWHDSNELRASMRRIDAEMKTIKPDWVPICRDETQGETDER